MRQYYVYIPGASPHGPFAEAMVKSAYEQGMYPPGTKVWWEGATQWELVELVFDKGAPDVVPSPPSAITPDIGKAGIKNPVEKIGSFTTAALSFSAVYASNRDIVRHLRYAPFRARISALFLTV